VRLIKLVCYQAVVSSTATLDLFQFNVVVPSNRLLHPIPSRDLVELRELQYYWPLVGFPVTLDISLRRAQWGNWRFTSLTRDSEGLVAFQIQAEPPLIRAHATCAPNTRFYLKSTWSRKR